MQMNDPMMDQNQSSRRNSSADLSGIKYNKC